MSLPRVRSLLTPGTAFLALLVAGLHLAWLAYAAHSWNPPTPAPTASEPPRMILLDYLPSAPELGARELGSPVLFAFPSAPGFSGIARASRTHVPSVLQADGSEPVLLDGPVRDAGPAAAAAAQELPHLLASASAAPAAPPADAPVFSAAPGSTGFVLQVYWPDGLPAVRSGLPGAGLLAPVLKDRAWELAALLVFDATGMVQNIFLEKPTSQRERNDTVIRALRQLRIEPPGAEVRARIALVYDQGAPLRTPPGAGAGAAP